MQTFRQGEAIRLVARPNTLGVTESWRGTVEHTTIEWGTGRKGVTVIVTEAPAGMEACKNYSMSFGLDNGDWVAVQMPSAPVKPYGAGRDS